MEKTNASTSRAHQVAHAQSDECNSSAGEEEDHYDRGAYPKRPRRSVSVRRFPMPLVRRSQRKRMKRSRYSGYSSWTSSEEEGESETSEGTHQSNSEEENDDVHEERDEKIHSCDDYKEDAYQESDDETEEEIVNESANANESYYQENHNESVRIYEEEQQSSSNENDTDSPTPESETEEIQDIRGGNNASLVRLFRDLNNIYTETEPFTFGDGRIFEEEHMLINNHDHPYYKNLPEKKKYGCICGHCSHIRRHRQLPPPLQASPQNYGRDQTGKFDQ